MIFVVCGILLVSVFKRPFHYYIIVYATISPAYICYIIPCQFFQHWTTNKVCRNFEKILYYLQIYKYTYIYTTIPTIYINYQTDSIIIYCSISLKVISSKYYRIHYMDPTDKAKIEYLIKSVIIGSMCSMLWMGHRVRFPNGTNMNCI